MKITALSPDDAIRLGQQLPYAYITELSRVTVGTTPVDLLPAELLEARFFGEKEEILIYQDTADLAAVSVTEECGDVWTDSIRNIRDPKFGHRLTVREYIDYDEDGQAFISRMRLLRWEEAKHNG